MIENHDTLVVAPYIGEFGWELMSWQGRVRYLVNHSSYRRVIVCARPDRRLLYTYSHTQGRVLFCPVSSCELPGSANDDHRIGENGEPLRPDYLRAVVEAKVSVACARIGIDTAEADVFMPDYVSRLWPATRTYQDFGDLRQREAVTTDVLLVPRDRGLAPERNQPETWWDALAEQLRDEGLVVEMYVPKLDAAVKQLSRCRLAVGASTGGLHLASLCRCPHFVWGPGSESRWTELGMTNRQRYETVWNPLGTPCRFDECGWRPPVEQVFKNTLVALDEIGLGAGQTQPAWSLKPTWRMKRQFARLLEPGPRRDLMPWRIRNLVREHLV